MTISQETAFKQFIQITSDTERSFEAKLRDLLELGRSYLDIQCGFLTRITDGEQSIVESTGDNELLQPGNSCPIDKAYCRKTVQMEGAMTVQHAAIQGWEGDAAYEEFGLESYIGSRVVVDGEIYGTFCYAGSEPRGEPFSENEETFVEMIAEWVGFELMRDRLLQELSDERDRLEQFVSVVSHDLRSPLNVAQGRVELAREECDSTHLDAVDRAHTQMAKLITDLLALANKGDHGIATPVSLSSVATETWETVDTGDSRLSVETDLMLWATRNRLKQLLTNLFRNAIDHGGGDVTVTVGDLHEGEGFYIADDGAGLPADAAEKLFEAGYTTGGGGTGLGLSIVADIASEHGWTVSPATSDSGGAQFEIRGIDQAA